VHKNCSSHLGVDGGAINIVDRPTSEEKKEFNDKTFSTKQVKSLEVGLVLTNGACTQ
jgi:hypothetical protein